MSLTRRNWFLHRVAPTSVLLATAGVTAVLPTVASAAAPIKKTVLDCSLRIHQILQAGAQLEPEKVVSVIVQKRLKGKGAAKNAEIANAHGGKITYDFDEFIRCFAMDIKQKNVWNLARNPNVAFISPNSKCHLLAIPTANLLTTHLQTINVPAVWNGSTPATGQGVKVAVLDSGVRENHPDMHNLTKVVINARATGANDKNGHGSHVIGIINGDDSLGRYKGVAPNASVLSVQIADNEGFCREADLIAGLQWVHKNKAAHNIKIVNLSLNGAVPSSYKTNPICAAVETLMMTGVTCVVAAGNRGAVANAVQFAPANDPFCITVGALDNADDTVTANDSLAPFSSRGATVDQHAKPEIVAPGRKIVSALASSSCTLAGQFPERRVGTDYIRLSGTSMAAPVVAGVLALLFERFPNVTPNQAKWLLTETMKPYPGQVGSAGVVDPVALLARAALGNIGQANQGLQYNNTVAEKLSSLAGTTTTTSAYWDSAYWDSAYWDSAYWDSAYWDLAAFDNATYEMFTGE